MYTLRKDILYIINDVINRQDASDSIKLEELDSLSTFIIISEIEKKYGIAVTFDEIISLKNIDDIVNIVQIKSGNKHGGIQNVK